MVRDERADRNRRETADCDTAHRLRARTVGAAFVDERDSVARKRRPRRGERIEPRREREGHCDRGGGSQAEPQGRTSWCERRRDARVMADRGDARKLHSNVVWWWVAFVLSSSRNSDLGSGKC